MHGNRFTTSGLQRKPQQVTRNTFPRITKIEKEYLTSNPTFLGLSSLAQKSLQQEVQDSFFAWMMENRKDGKTTTPLMKEMMYNSISEKHIAAIEDGPGLFGFLIGSSAAPAFQGVDDLCADVKGGEDLSPAVVKFQTGVIPSSTNQIVLSFPPTPFSRQLGPYEVSTLFQPVLDVKPFLELVHNSDEAVPVDDSRTNFMCEGRSTLQYSEDPNVADTLREIKDIHVQISKLCNTPNLDSLLGPSDWFNQKYSGSPLSLIREAEQ